MRLHRPSGAPAQVGRAPETGPIGRIGPIRRISARRVQGLEMSASVGYTDQLPNPAAARGSRSRSIRMASTHGRAAVVVTALLLALVLAGGNVFVLAQRILGAPGVPLADAIAQAYAADPSVFLYLALSPLAAGIVLALVAATGRPSQPETTAVAEAESTAAPHASALRLLALLQQEGRLIDFLEEDIDAYDDAQVGAAVRAIHAGCRKALRERMRIERIRPEDDGASLAIERGFDPAELRLTGNVHGQPPFRGTLQHGGWRASEVKLPAGSAADAAILAPAEVEIG
jgi:hypothetical protein